MDKRVTKKLKKKVLCFSKFLYKTRIEEDEYKINAYVKPRLFWYMLVFPFVFITTFFQYMKDFLKELSGGLLPIETRILIEEKKKE